MKEFLLIIPLPVMALAGLAAVFSQMGQGKLRPSALFAYPMTGFTYTIILASNGIL